jgi:hypothetical protein
LRWLCSDLTEENVTMLKQERPEITFVSWINSYLYVRRSNTTFVQ